MQLEIPRKVVIKTMTVNRNMDDVFDFFEDVKKSMEAGGAAKSVAKGSDGWWTFDHIVAGKSKMKHTPIKEAGVLDHVFVGAGLEWHAYVRIVPNQGGATVTWTFVRPDGLTDEQFERQLDGFDHEIVFWKSVLERTSLL
jgi:hypothetical protein